jgi:hypothetical protein
MRKPCSLPKGVKPPPNFEDQAPLEEELRLFGQHREGTFK